MERAEAAGKTIRDVRFYFPVIAAQGIIGFVTAVLATKLFSPEEYGGYVLAFALYSQLSLVTAVWLQVSIIRFATHYRSRKEFQSFASTLLFAEVILVSFLALFLAVLLWALPGGSGHGTHVSFLMIVAVAGALLFPFVSAIEQLYRIDDHPRSYCCVVLFRIFCGPALGLLLSKGLHLGIAGFFSGVVGPYLVLFCFFVYVRKGQIISLLKHRTISSAVLKEVILFSGPLVGVTVVNSFLVLSDRYLIAWYSGAHDVALYNIAYVIANQGVEVITMVLLATGDPIAMRMLERQGMNKAFLYLGQLLRYYSLLAIPAAVGLTVLGRQLIPMVSTGAYAQSWPVIGYVAAAVLFCGYAQIVSRAFQFTKKTLTPLYLCGIAAAVNILLNVVLIPHFGYMAAAWSKLAGYLLLFLVISLAVSRSASLGFSFRPCFRMAGSALFMGAIIYLIKATFVSAWLNLGLCLLVGASCYLLALVVSGEISAMDVNAAFRAVLGPFKSTMNGRKAPKGYSL